MHRSVAWVVGCLVIMGFLASAPPAAANATVRGEEARAAIDAALRFADIEGMTYEAGGQQRQRNAASDVAVTVEQRGVDRVLLRDGERLRLLAPYVSATSYPRIARAVLEAYGVAGRPMVTLPVDDAEARDFTAWFDPFAPYVDASNVEVSVDSSGRATQMTVDGETVVRILRWDAPLAIRPAADRIMDASTGWTVAAVESSAEFSYGVIEQLASIAERDRAYDSKPVVILRRVARNTGWQAHASEGGVTVATTDVLGARWKATLVADPGGVHVRTYALTAHRAVMPREEAAARMALGIMAMGQVDLLACPAACRMTGRPAPLTVANAESRVLGQLRSVGITGPTPGPDYARIGPDMLGSLGLEVSRDVISGSVSFASAGYCVTVPITGPGVLSRPDVYRTARGSVGPWGTCRG